MTTRPVDSQLDEVGTDPEQVGPASGGQSGDTQGLSKVAEAADESVQELAETGQDYEAEVIEGVEDAADHPERPARTHEGHNQPPLNPARRRPSTM